ncbi:MAG: Xaa-Pro aminopeptidase [Verrucomicrobia subdivision 3 bacterium]|nr:Xaa-Pro aminopeptidase [Limisphaerales bacterium]
MRQPPIDPQLFIDNRKRLAALLPAHSLAVVNANDVLPTNADGSLRLVPNSDLFYLTGVEQEQSILLLYPDADDPKTRELLFLRQPDPKLEIWEGHKLTRDEARRLTGIHHVHWLDEFPALFHRLMCECDCVCLNANEHPRAELTVETRETRFVADVVRRYPLHEYQRLGLLMRQLRQVKSSIEIDLIGRACAATKAGFERVAKFVKPGVYEYEIEAEFAHEFLRRGAAFAYTPIIASGRNACALHYVANDQQCRAGDLLLLDVAAAYANYNADLTRTIPISGRFSPRQRDVYSAVLRVLRAQLKGLLPGKKWRVWQEEAEQLMERELLGLKLITPRDIKNQDPDEPAFKKYFMHGVGHPLGLDVHDLGVRGDIFAPGWIMTVEPGIYLPDEGFAVRLETDVLITANGPVDLMADIPIEIDDLESLMSQKR